MEVAMSQTNTKPAPPRPDPALELLELREEAARAIGEDRVPSEVLRDLLADYGDTPTTPA
jgi:hypothetical protein